MNTPEVRLEMAAPSDAPLLANLLELYIHDLSEVFALKIGADGRFGYGRLPLYWSEPETRFPYLIRSGAELAGFALIMRGSPASANPNVFDVSEFFVLRSHRGSGVGQRAAVALWGRLRGDWVVRVGERNRPALSFWERTIRDYANRAYQVGEHQGETQTFRVFTFASR